MEPEEMTTTEDTMDQESDLTPDQAAASLAFLTNISEQQMIAQNPQNQMMAEEGEMAEEPMEEEMEEETEEPEEDKIGDLDKKFSTQLEEVKNTVKEEMASFKKEILDALKDEED